MPKIFDFNEDVCKSLKQLQEYAENHPYTMNDILDVLNGSKEIAGYIPEHTLILPFDYRIVYSIEQQVKGDVRHLSISVKEEGQLPDSLIVEEIMRLLGFTTTLENCLVELEDINEIHQAVNIWEII